MVPAQEEHCPRTNMWQRGERVLESTPGGAEAAGDIAKQ
jgi:hypothetical protein